MFSDRMNGSLLHNRKIVKQTPGDPEKEVYDVYITDKTE